MGRRRSPGRASRLGVVSLYWFLTVGNSGSYILCTGAVGDNYWLQYLHIDYEGSASRKEDDGAFKIVPL